MVENGLLKISGYSASGLEFSKPLAKSNVATSIWGIAKWPTGGLGAELGWAGLGLARLGRALGAGQS